MNSSPPIDLAVDPWPASAVAATSPATASPLTGRKRLNAVWLNGIEGLLLLGFYGWLVARLCLAYQEHGGFANLLLLPSEGLVVFFILIRRRTDQVSRHAGEWFLAAAATCAPLLVRAEPGEGLLPTAFPAVLLLMGLIVQLHAKITLGRSFGCVPANRGLKLAGPYRFVRHPMYAGYLLSHLAFLLMNPTLWNVALYVFADGLQIPRLLAEERLLSKDPQYRSYQEAVRWRLIPGVF